MTKSGRAQEHADDTGSATILMLALMAAVLLVGALDAVWGSAVVARHRVESAADFGALAGAVHAVEGEGPACAAAARIVAANHARQSSCHVEGLHVTVEAQRDITVFGAGRVAVGHARAGPASSIRAGAGSP